MRLICPRCGAQYEIDGAAVPLTGRDVECSACDHVWRAMPPVESFDPEARPQLSRKLSDSVIEILREEAAHELENRAAERRADRAAERAAEFAAEIAEPLRDPDSISDLAAEDTVGAEVPADERAKALPERDDPDAALSPSEDRVPRRTRPLPAKDDDEPRSPDLDPPSDVPPAGPAVATFDAAPVPVAQPDAAPSQRVVARKADAGSGYRTGILVAVLVAVAAVALYALSPRLAGQGAVGATLAEWRTEVDRGRDWLALSAEAATDRLRAALGRE